MRYEKNTGRIRPVKHVDPVAHATTAIEIIKTQLQGVRSAARKKKLEAKLAFWGELLEGQK